MEIVYIDTLFKLGGSEHETVLVDCEIGVPGEYFFKLQSDYFSQVNVIETQLPEVAVAIGFHIRDIKWIPKIEIENDNKMKISIVARQYPPGQVQVHKS